MTNGNIGRGNGGGGGGVLLIAASGVIDVGSGAGAVIRANGGMVCDLSGRSIAGSGGAIRLVANVLKGNRRLEALTGCENCGGAPFAEQLAGRIRLEAARAMQY